VQVKENQKQLLDDCRITAQKDAPVDTFIAPPESGHGRIEHRQCRVFIPIHIQSSTIVRTGLNVRTLASRRQARIHEARLHTNSQSIDT
jgi:hypothetical protein